MNRPTDSASQKRLYEHGYKMELILYINGERVDSLVTVRCIRVVSVLGFSPAGHRSAFDRQRAIRNGSVCGQYRLYRCTTRSFADHPQIFSSALEDATLARLGAGRTISHSVLESLNVAVKLAPREIVSLTRTGSRNLAMQPLSEDVRSEANPQEPELDVGKEKRCERSWRRRSRCDGCERRCRCIRCVRSERSERSERKRLGMGWERVEARRRRGDRDGIG